MRPTHLRAIDGLRAVAVLGVVAHHASLLPFGIGARGVELFFVISGFCLSLPTLEKLTAGRAVSFDRTRFFLGRAARIMPPYYAALVLFWLLSLTAFGTPSVLVPPSRFEWLFEALFMTASVHGGGGAPSYNASFWTLGVEARWYLLFPLLLSLYVRSRPLFACAGLAFYAVAALVHGLLDIGTLPCFMSGIVAADLYVHRKAASPWFVPAAAVCFALATCFDRTDAPDYPLWHATAFFMVVAGVGVLRRVMAWRPLVVTGAASYSIYLVHQPLLVWTYYHHVPLWWCVGLSIAAGFVFWRCVELPSIAAFAFLRQRREMSTAVAPA